MNNIKRLLIIIAFVSLVLNIDINDIKPLIFTLIIGSPILSILTLIGSAMMLTNIKNLTLGSLIVLPLSIPIIIFAVGSINTDPDLFISQIYILVSILLALLAVAPWIISTCIKIILSFSSPNPFFFRNVNIHVNKNTTIKTLASTFD